jgi:thiazole synthase
MQHAIEQSNTAIVTVALRRIDIAAHEENILSYIPKDRILLVNTSGARTALEALRLARLGREAGYGNWVKIDIKQ